jgi:hypothetical protein
MDKRNRVLAILGCMLCLLPPACSRYRAATTLRGRNLRTYSGPLRPKDAVGYLTCSASDMEIAAIDSVSIRDMKFKAGFEGAFSYLELLPGEHTVLVRGTYFESSRRGFHTNLTVDVSSLAVSMGGEAELSFEVEPGHVYVIQAKIEGAGSREQARDGESILSISIKDAITGNIVIRTGYPIRKGP